MHNAPLPVLVGVLAFLYGSCIGSFANAAAMRLLCDEDPIFPSSRCRFCARPLHWYENLPLIGYLLLWGRCGCKKMLLPVRYLAVELAIGSLFFAYAASLPLWSFLALSLAAAIITIAFLTDLTRMVLWVPSLLLGCGLGLLAAIFVPSWPIPLSSALIGAALGAGLIIICDRLYRLIRGCQGFGGGDIWLMAMIGAWSGTVGAVVIFFGAVYLGAGIGIALILLGQRGFASKLPFGVFLSIVFLLYPMSYTLLV